MQLPSWLQWQSAEYQIRNYQWISDLKQDRRVYFHCIRDQVRDGSITVTYIPTNEIIRDGFIKIYHKVKQEELGGKLGLTVEDEEWQMSGGVLEGERYLQGRVDRIFMGDHDIILGISCSTSNCYIGCNCPLWYTLGCPIRYGYSLPNFPLPRLKDTSRKILYRARQRRV